MQTSQHPRVEQLITLEGQNSGRLHAATDITGFGLLGHLGEMLEESDSAPPSLQIQLEASRIPALPGAMEVLTAGYASSLAPANRRAWSLLDSKEPARQPAVVCLNWDECSFSSQERQALLELLVDPQTCGPLLISVSSDLAESLLRQQDLGWHAIGRVNKLPMT